MTTASTHRQHVTEIDEACPAPKRLTKAQRKELNAQCRKYNKHRVKEKTEKALADAIKPWLIAMVNDFGTVPPTAERSVRLETSAWITTVMKAIETEIDAEQVEKFQRLLVRAKLGHLFPQVFRRKVTYTLVETAKEVMETTPWPKRRAEKIILAYALCTNPKPRVPSLDVESRASYMERVRIHEEKAAAKAAKAARKKAA